MLNIDSVELSFYGKQVISGCYISVQKGEIVGLLGRNGSGKSSLLKIIFGILKAQFHHLRIEDQLIKKGFLSKEIAYLAQENFLPPFVKVIDLLPFSIFEEMDFIQTLKNKKIGELSGGELRIVECYWILSRDANYILLDEPFKGLSPIAIHTIKTFICSQKSKKGIILTDHNYEHLVEVSDRIVLMHNNAIYNINNLEDLIHLQYLPASKLSALQNSVKKNNTYKPSL